MAKSILEIVAIDGGGLPNAQRTSGGDDGSSSGQRGPRFTGPKRADAESAAQGPAAQKSGNKFWNFFGFDKVAKQIDRLGDFFEGLLTRLYAITKQFTGNNNAPRGQHQAWNLNGGARFTPPPAQPGRGNGMIYYSPNTGVMAPGHEKLPAISGPSSSASQVAALAPAAAEAEGALAFLSRAAGPLALAFVAVAASIKLTTSIMDMQYRAVKFVVGKLTSESERLQQYSGPLSAAEAEKKIRQEMRDMQRAQEAGPNIAKFTSNLSRLGDLPNRIGTQFYKHAARWANTYLTPLANLFGNAMAFNDPFMGALLGEGKGMDGQQRRPAGVDLNAGGQRI